MASIKVHLDKWHCNSICQKTGNTSTGTTLSMLKIYLRCLIHIVKVKYTEFKLLHFCLPNGLPACRKTLWLGLQFFHTIKVITILKLLFRRKFIYCTMAFPFILY